MIDQERLANYLLSCTGINLDKPFTWSSGIKAPLLVDTGLLMGDVKPRNLFIEALSQKVNTLEERSGKINTLAGIATSGIWLTAMTADKLNKPLVVYDAKDSPSISGLVMSSQQILVIENVVSLAGSSIRAAKELRKQGAAVSHILAIYSHFLEQTKKNLDQANLSLEAVVYFDDLFKALQLTGITPHTQQVLLDWHQDPFSWAKKYIHS